MHKYVVAFKPNATMHLVHHMLVYGCRTPGYREWDSPRVVWDCDEMSTSRTLFPKGPICQTGSQVVYGWARNAPPLRLPEDGITRDSSGVVLSVVPGNDTGFVKLPQFLGLHINNLVPKPGNQSPGQHTRRLGSAVDPHGKTEDKRTTRRAQNTKLINEASALLQNQDSTISQIATVAERLRANNDEFRRLNEEFEGHIPDGSFETKFQAVVQYEDEATATISAL
ncbi:hypothetical protein HPB47_022146 [Ixodes persulcatus]|uniref:Uncharacterized protein n=1 Tax=Ixodes persulcatus TaxID=34615 RepID=A0AC60QCT2_IXOPE|nr:hypothetical protein HPB47_022146 [Ixodes persulcatus]